MSVRIEEGWKQALSAEWESPYFAQLSQFVHAEYRTRQVFPPGRQIFAAFDATPFDQVKVVMLKTISEKENSGKKNLTGSV